MWVDASRYHRQDTFCDDVHHNKQTILFLEMRKTMEHYIAYAQNQFDNSDNYAHDMLNKLESLPIAELSAIDRMEIGLAIKTIRVNPSGLACRLRRLHEVIGHIDRPESKIVADSATVKARLKQDLERDGLLKAERKAERKAGRKQVLANELAERTKRVDVMTKRMARFADTLASRLESAGLQRETPGTVSEFDRIEDEVEQELGMTSLF